MRPAPDEGQHCDVSMVDGLDQLGRACTRRNCSQPGDAPEPGNGMLTGRYPCYRIYPCADGFLAVGTLEPKFWHAFVEALGVPDGRASSASPRAQRRAHHRNRADGLANPDALPSGAMPSQGSTSASSRCLRCDETFEHPQVRSRGMRLDAGEGRPTAQVGFPIRLTGSPATFRAAPPDTVSTPTRCSSEAGYDAGEIASLRAAGAIR